MVTGRKMHADELEIDAELVRALLADQLPQWSELPLGRVPSFGTDNALFRLGDDLVVRLPRIEWAVEGAIREYDWLPRLAPHLPVAVPTPVAKGAPAVGYPWPWFVYEWLDGENPTLADANFLAADLAEFVNAIRRIDATGAPRVWRGRPLETQIAAFEKWLAAQDETVDADAARSVWADALRAPAWSGAPVWFHGDLLTGNLLVREGQLHAVIDFATAGAGDPAIDLLPAWGLFDAESRERFRADVDADAATWARSRGWALLLGLAAFPYYEETNPVLAATGRRFVRETLADMR